MGAECPGWYSPTARIKDYEQDSATATVTVEHGFLDDIRADMFALYVCDDARYVEHADGWVLERIDPGALLFEIGIRDGDRNAVVQGFDPHTMDTTTVFHTLDSVHRMQLAYEALVDSDGLVITVARPETMGGEFTIWISVE